MILQILKQHIYFYLLLLTIVEGPITSFVSAGFAAQGVLRIEYVALIAFSGDLIGDLILYIIGRFFGKISFLKKFKYFSNEKLFLSKRLKKSAFLYMLIVKFTPYLSAPSLIFAGAKKMNIWLFTFYSFIISMLVKIVYLTIGYLGSITIKQLEFFLSGRKQIALYIISGIILFLITKNIYQYIGKRIKKEIGE